MSIEELEQMKALQDRIACQRSEIAKLSKEIAERKERFYRFYFYWVTEWQKSADLAKRLAALEAVKQ